jgi:hypothetical protein
MPALEADLKGLQASCHCTHSCAPKLGKLGIERTARRQLLTTMLLRTMHCLCRIAMQKRHSDADEASGDNTRQHGERCVVDTTNCIFKHVTQFVRITFDQAHMLPKIVDTHL